MNNNIAFKKPIPASRYDLQDIDSLFEVEHHTGVAVARLRLIRTDATPILRLYHVLWYALFTHHPGDIVSAFST